MAQESLARLNNPIFEHVFVAFVEHLCGVVCDAAAMAGNGAEVVKAYHAGVNQSSVPPAMTAWWTFRAVKNK